LQALVQSFLVVGSLFDQISDNKRADHYMRLGAHLCVMHELPLNNQTTTSWQSKFQLHCDAVRARQESDRPFSLIALLQAAVTPSIDPFFLSPTPKASSTAHFIDSHYLEMMMRKGDRFLEQGDISAACSTWKEAARLVRKALSQSALAQVIQPGVASASGSASITENDLPASLATSQIAPNLALLACRLARRRAAALFSTSMLSNFESSKNSIGSFLHICRSETRVGHRACVFTAGKGVLIGSVDSSVHHDRRYANHLHIELAVWLQVMRIVTARCEENNKIHQEQNRCCCTQLQ
jgi:hypothetical protein